MKVFRVNGYISSTSHKMVPSWYLDKDDAEWAARMSSSDVVEEEMDVYEFAELYGLIINGFPDGWYYLDDAMVIVREFMREFGDRTCIRSGEAYARAKEWL